jgi:hypothetical protein
MEPTADYIDTVEREAICYSLFDLCVLLILICFRIVKYLIYDM